MRRDKSLTVPVFEYLGLKLNAKVHAMGHCNGICCLLTNWDSVALWNPANRESKALPAQTFPNSIPPRMELERNTFGFGMDPFTGDYKVVSIWTYHWVSGLHDDIHPSSYPKHIAIYSLHDDSWRDFKGFFFFFPFLFFPKCSVSSIYKFYTYIDGVYYWCASDKNDDATKLSFHMGYEEFQNILEQDEPMSFKGIPELGCPDPETNLVKHYFGVYNSSLAWIQCYSTHYVAPNIFNIWVLKEERWTRELIGGPFEGAISLGFWKKGEFLIQVEDEHLYLVDPITLEMKDLRIVAS
ncbi:F-box/kelch-repeat protein [Camellia lanceoleosa]|uniref:F-box/kelch-repeat protein n=1 Tax=Camellia lanceoleosa TaxID=1840588 RepID=A0ACC0G0Q8_9ERIC|nr:F-box/kelch-repeat protein [Camellia lanceoleosa]